MKNEINELIDYWYSNVENCYVILYEHKPSDTLQTTYWRSSALPESSNELFIMLAEAIEGDIASKEL